MYHLTYAADWANAGYLKIDPFIRFPLAQFNVELLFAMCMVLHLTAYVQFVTWIFFAMSATG